MLQSKAGSRKNLGGINEKVHVALRQKENHNTSVSLNPILNGK